MGGSLKFIFTCLNYQSYSWKKDPIYYEESRVEWPDSFIAEVSLVQ